MITKDYFEKQLRKHGSITVYSQTNIPLTISQAPYICTDSGIDFEMDCQDLRNYCAQFGLTVSPVKTN